MLHDNIKPRISAINITKEFKLYRNPVHRFKEALNLGTKTHHEKFVALDNISLEIAAGAHTGLMGNNGGGKSTLLQIMSGIMRPTSGSIQVDGRVSALLSLGAGFNPEFTGRENIYLAGALSGYNKAHMDERMDAIVQFSELEEFIDQPVIHYSSGMYARLAFSCAVR